jgi:hypothetical protein
MMRQQLQFKTLTSFMTPFHTQKKKEQTINKTP